jgi:hypothetical protein
VRAVELAAELGVDPKRLRQWLRDHYPHEHNAAWVLSADQIEAARAHFTGRSGSSGTTPARQTFPPAAGQRQSSDEAYVIDICDETFGERALRQHRFPWLLGDPSASGARVQLPVDAYYAQHGVVVEYRERQHTEATPFFDRRLTLSGVGRGEQRRIYDRRRADEIPAHGLRLVVISTDDLTADRRVRLRRDRLADSRVIRERLSPT